MTSTSLRLEGLEPDNPLAFLALLGLLRSLEESAPHWRPRLSWDLDAPPLRPRLVLRGEATEMQVCEAAADGVASLADFHTFDGKADINHTAAEARSALTRARDQGGYQAALVGALFNDAVLKEDKDQVEATPLCLLFGQGHQHFLSRLAAVPRQPAPPLRGRGKKSIQISAAQCFQEALFQPWHRQDPTFSFRWDPAEDVRYALIADDPSSTKGLTQHGANRLAAIGLAALPVAAIRQGERLRPVIPGGRFPRGGFRFAWPVWRDPASLDTVIALLSHPGLLDADASARLGIDHVRETQRISVGKFMNLTVGRVLEKAGSAPP